MIQKFVPALAFIILLTGCAAKVSNNPGTRAIAGKAYRFSSVEVRIDDNATQGMPDSNNFRLEVFRQKLQNRFRIRGLIHKNSPHRVVVRVKRIFIRDAASAVIFGFFAGEDRIVGDVSVLNRSGEQQEKFTVKAGNSLGGVTAAISSARAEWMYNKFAQLTVQVFTGKKAQ